MDWFRLTCYLALFIVFCNKCDCVNKAKIDEIRTLVNEANHLNPFEIMNVAIGDLSFEKGGEIEQFNANEPLTFIGSDHLVRRSNSSGSSSLRTYTYRRFIVKPTTSDSGSESTFTFWDVQIESFIYFIYTGNEIKLTLIPEFKEGVVILTFLDSGNAQEFWRFAMKNYGRNKTRLTGATRFEIFNRASGTRAYTSPFVLIDKESIDADSAIYTVYLEFQQEQKPLLIFSSGQFSVSNVIEDHVGLILSDQPHLIIVLKFDSSDNDSAVKFHADVYGQQNKTSDSISDAEMTPFINYSDGGMYSP